MSQTAELTDNEALEAIAAEVARLEELIEMVYRNLKNYIEESGLFPGGRESSTFDRQTWLKLNEEKKWDAHEVDRLETLVGVQLALRKCILDRRRAFAKPDWTQGQALKLDSNMRPYMTLDGCRSGLAPNHIVAQD